jgi:hypothetical protein
MTAFHETSNVRYRMIDKYRTNLLPVIQHTILLQIRKSLVKVSPIALDASLHPLPPVRKNIE